MPSGSSAPATSCGPTRAAAGWPRTRPAWWVWPRRSAARRCGAWRRTPCCRAVRAGASASRCWPRPSTTGAACSRGMLSASSDARAVRIYRQAGFDLHPQMYLTGTVDRSAIPVVEKVREGSAGDVDLMDSLDRAARGAGARAGPRADAADVAAPGLRHEHRVRLRLPRRARTTGRPGREQPAHGRAAPLGGPGRGARAGAPCRTSRVRTSGCSTSGSRPGSSCTRRATSALRGMKPPAPYVHNGALL